MSNEKSVKPTNDRTKNEKEVKSGSDKADRLDRLEENMEQMSERMERLESGVLILINMVGWLNATITPIGTHDPEAKFNAYSSIEDAEANEGV